MSNSMDNITGEMDPHLHMNTDNILLVSVKWPVICIAILSLVFEFVSIYSMALTTRIPHAIRYLAICILLHEACFLLIHILLELLSDTFVLKWKLFRLRRTCIQISWFVITIVALERMVAVRFPWFYEKYSKRLVNGFVMFFIPFAWIMLAGRVIFTDDKKELTKTQLNCIVTNTLIVFYSTLIIVSYTQIGLIYRNILRRTLATETLGVKNTNNKNLFKLTKCLGILTSSFLITHLPIAVECSAFRCNYDPYVYCYTYILLIMYCTISPILYIWRFKECRLIFISALWKTTRVTDIEVYVVQLRMDVYDIPIIE